MAVKGHERRAALKESKFAGHKEIMEKKKAHLCPVVLALRRSKSEALTVASDTDNVKLLVVSAIASKLTMLSERVADIAALVLDSSADI